jgi:hypothetical protein
VRRLVHVVVQELRRRNGYVTSRSRATLKRRTKEEYSETENRCEELGSSANCSLMVLADNGQHYALIV